MRALPSATYSRDEQAGEQYFRHIVVRVDLRGWCPIRVFSCLYRNCVVARQGEVDRMFAVE